MLSFVVGFFSYVVVIFFWKIKLLYKQMDLWTKGRGKGEESKRRGKGWSLSNRLSEEVILYLTKTHTNTHTPRVTHLGWEKDKCVAVRWGYQWWESSIIHLVVSTQTKQLCIIKHMPPLLQPHKLYFQQQLFK